MSNGPWQPRGQGPRNPNPWGSGPSGGGGREPRISRTFFAGARTSCAGCCLAAVRAVVMVDFPGLAPSASRFIGLLAIVGWLLTGFYTVRPNEMGIERVFGRFASITAPGLNWNWPYPVGRIDKPTIGVQTIEVGLRSGAGPRGGIRDVREESLMLTGDENIVDVDFSVLWLVDARRPQDFVFNLRSPEATVKAVAESAMREIVGRREIQPILTGARLEIERAVQS